MGEPIDSVAQIIMAVQSVTYSVTLIFMPHLTIRDEL